MMSRSRSFLSMALSGLLVLSACGKNDGSASSNTSSNNSSPSTATATTAASSVFSMPGSEALTVADVQKIISRAVAEASAQGKPAVIAVVDRVGNVLAVYSMTGAPSTATVRAAANPANNTDLQGLSVPAGG